MKKIIWICSCLIVVTVLYIIIDYFRPHKIDLEYSGIIYTNESKFEKNTLINIHGDLYKHPFGRKEFIGELTLDGDVKQDIIFYQEDNKYLGLLTSIESEYRTIKTKGSVLISNNFDKVWIQSDEVNSKYGIVQGYIAGPANTINEANDIARSIAEIAK